MLSVLDSRGDVDIERGCDQDRGCEAKKKEKCEVVHNEFV